MGLSYWLVKYQEGQLRKCESLGFESSEHNFLGQSCMVKEDERERGIGWKQGGPLEAPLPYGRRCFVLKPKGLQG